MIDQIIEKYYSRIYAFALVHVISEDIAKDLTQDVFLKLVKKEQKLKNIEDLEAYIFTIARNTTYKYFKKIHRTNRLKKEMMNSFREKFVNPEESIVAGDLEEKFREIIDQLPDRQREIFRLSREKGLSYIEIAEKLNISPNTVRNHLAQARKTLKMNYRLFGISILWLVLILS